MTRHNEPQPPRSTAAPVPDRPRSAHLDRLSNVSGDDIDVVVPGVAQGMRTPRHRRRADAVTTTRSLVVQQALISAGLDLVDESGLAGVTVRALAARTHYSPSTIGYHATPMQRFVELLWEELGQRFVADTLVPHEPTRDRAERMLGWAAHNPHRATFFLRHAPLDARKLVATLRADGITRRTAEDIDPYVARYVVRRLQAAIEFSLSQQHPAEAIAITAASLRDDLHCDPGLRA